MKTKTLLFIWLCSLGLMTTAANATPSVSGITPDSTQIGATITITGTGYDPVPAKNFVIFTGGAVQVPTSSTTTSMQVIVPLEAESGPIEVYSDGSTSAPSSQSLTIAPGITSFTPMTSYAEQLLTITGYGFSATASNNTVNFSGGVTAKPVSATTNTLQVIVPQGATTGSFSVTTNGDQSQNTSVALAIQCPTDLPQTQLDNGATPFSVYKSCGMNTDILYGLTYGGGLIAYLDTTDGSGLIAAPSDYYYTTWGGYDVKVTGTKSGIGTGKANTDLIIKAVGKPQAGGSYAAYLSKTHHYSGYTDWFLPSIDELTEVVTNLNIVYASKTSRELGSGCLYQRGHFTPYLVSGYLSSTVPATGPAWRDYFLSKYYQCGMPKSGQPYNLVRKYPSAVRMVRSFKNSAELGITSFTPTSQVIGGTITITGSGFSASRNKNIVYFAGGVLAIPKSATATQLQVVIPQGTQTGVIQVRSNNLLSPVSLQTLTIETSRQAKNH